MKSTSKPAGALARVDIIGVAVDDGGSREGARYAPSALRAANLGADLEALRYSVHDAGDITPSADDASADHQPNVKHLAVIRKTCATLADAVERSFKAGSFPLILGGDHSIAIGVMAGVHRALGAQGMIWFDAHADMNTSLTTPSGNLHGMAAAAVLGDLAEYFPPPIFPAPSADPARCVFVGLRELDPGEQRAVRERGMQCFTMSDIDRSGLAKIMERAIELAGPQPRSAHVSLDIDCLDPELAPGTGTPVRGGLTYREAHLAMEMIAESSIAHSMEIVEINPKLDPEGRTARVAVELACSALGKSIL